jgi:hypothetical protein
MNNEEAWRMGYSLAEKHSRYKATIAYPIVEGPEGRRKMSEAERSSMKEGYEEAWRMKHRRG